MLEVLTKYLLLYKRVSIPHVGSFELVQEPSRLEIADKVISAPFFITRYDRGVRVSEHQFDFLASLDEQERDRFRNELFSFGEHLSHLIRTRPFRWNGFGTLRFAANEIVFEPSEIGLASLPSVPAERVMRQNVQHRVLVGDQQITAREAADVPRQPRARMPVYLIIAWILLVLGVAAIVILLILGHFQISSAGLKWKLR